MGQDKDSIITKAGGGGEGRRAAVMQKQSLTTSHKQTDSHMVGATPTLEDKTSLLVFIAEHISLVNLVLRKTRESLTTVQAPLSKSQKTGVSQNTCMLSTQF